MFMRPHLNRKQLGVVACGCHPSDGRELKIGGSWSRLAWTKSETLSWETQHKKGAGGIDQPVEHLPSNCEALSSNSSTSKKRKDSGSFHEMERISLSS
jgi:hypothetical protein